MDHTSPRGWNKDQKNRWLLNRSPPYSTQLLKRWCWDMAKTQQTKPLSRVQNPNMKHSTASRCISRSTKTLSGDLHAKYRSNIVPLDILAGGHTPFSSRKAPWKVISSMTSTRDAAPKARRNTPNARRSNQRFDHSGGIFAVTAEASVRGKAMKSLASAESLCYVMSPSSPFTVYNIYIHVYIYTFTHIYIHLYTFIYMYILLSWYIALYRFHHIISHPWLWFCHTFKDDVACYWFMAVLMTFSPWRHVRSCKAR